jgi:uncharacterized repeat protein (TIGR01451 family)
MNIANQTLPTDVGVQSARQRSSTRGKILAQQPVISFSKVLVLVGLVLLSLGTKAFAHSNPPGCTGSALGINLFTSAPDVHIGDTLFYSATIFNGLPGSPRVACDATEIQAFIVTPDGKTNVLTLARTTLFSGQSDFYSNVVSYVVRAQDVLPDGTVRATANDKGIIHQNDTDSAGGGFQGVNTEVSLPCIKIAVQCVGGVGENGAITFTGSVTNCGNNTLVGVTITNFVNNGIFTVLFPTNLARGQSVVFSGSWIPSNPCVPSTATLVAHAVDQFTTIPRAVTSSASTTCANVVTPGIRVTKSCPTTPVSPGQLLVFSGSVSNTGNITLNNVIVVNNQPANNTEVFTLASLAPGATASFTGSYLAPTNCAVSDTLTVRAATACGVSVTNAATANCPILTTPRVSVTASCPVTAPLGGALLTYTGTVRNTGDITLTNVVVFSDRPAANTKVFTVNTLLPGASATFTGSYTVPTNVCSVTATLRVSGKDLCAGATASDTFVSTCNVSSSPAIAVTLTCPAISPASGGLITYSGTVRNAGNITLNNVSVVNNHPEANTVVFSVASLAPGASASFTASFTAPLDACSVSSTVVASASDNCTGGPISHTATATCSLITTPGVAITETCPTILATPGNPVIYSGTVRNTGNITLTNVVVLNNLSGATPILTLASLAPGAVTNFSGSYLAPTNCSSTSVSTVTGRGICGVSVTNSARATCAIRTSPDIFVTQTCSTTPVLPGGLLTYNGTVKNIGDVTLTNVQVFNDRSGTTPIFTLASLAPGGSANFSGSYLTHVDCCVDTSTVTATGQGCAGETVSDTATRTCSIQTLPKIVVTKVCAPGVFHPGDIMTYSGTVSNSGNITLVNVILANQQASNNSVVLGPIILVPGETSAYTVSYIVPADFCGDERVTASGVDLCAQTRVSDAVTTTCPVVTTPRIGVTKNCPASPVARGGLFTYTGRVTNLGDVTLVNVTVMDNQPTNNTLVLGPITLAPGASAEFSGSYIVARCKDCCDIIDTVTALGRGRCDNAIVKATASQVCPLLTIPNITLIQTCPTNPIPMGSSYLFSGSVSNSGDITLTNVYVFGPQGTNATLLGPIELAPGETEDYSGSYTVPFDSCLVTVSATGRSACNASNAVASVSCPVATTPRITLTQQCPSIVGSPGLVSTYSVGISNAGNISLVNIVITNNLSGSTPIFTAAKLAPGASTNFVASFIAPKDCAVGIISTARAASICGDSVTNTASSACPLVTSPAISVTKLCPPGPVPPGGSFVFTGTVTNTGNVTLTNVFVVDDQPGPNTPVIGPITLLPGAGTSFTGSYVIAGITNRSTNTVTTITTNQSTVLATNQSLTRVTNNVPPFLGTINPVSKAVVNRFAVTNGLEGLIFADQDKGYGAAQFYAIRKESGGSFFDTITVSTATVTDRFTATSRDFDSLTFAAPDVGYGSVIFYYLSHDVGGVSSFGSITPGGTVGVIADHFIVGPQFDSVTFSATDLGYGANLFYYLRHDPSGLSTFGTINPAQPGTITDRFTVGNNANALVFSPSDVGAGYGVNNFYFVRKDGAGVSTFGTIFVTGLASGVVTDRFVIGTNINEMAFTTTDAGFGPNLFYFLRGGVSVTTNNVTTITTNSVPTYSTNTVTTVSTNVVSGSASDTVTASGRDICQSRLVMARASCGASQPVIGGPGVPPPHYSNGSYSLSFASQSGVSYRVQYKNALSDPIWSDLPNMPVTGNGGVLTVTSPTAGQVQRFYRIIIAP